MANVRNMIMINIFVFFTLINICENGIFKDIVKDVKKIGENIKNDAKNIKEVTKEIKEAKETIKIGGEIIKTINETTKTIDSVSNMAASSLPDFLTNKDNIFEAFTNNIANLGDSINTANKVKDFMNNLNNNDDSNKSPLDVINILYQLNSIFDPKSNPYFGGDSITSFTNSDEILKISQLFLDLSGNLANLSFLRPIFEEMSDTIIKNPKISKKDKSDLINIIFDSGKDESFRKSFSELITGLSKITKNYDSILNENMTGLNEKFAKEFPDLLTTDLLNSFHNLAGSVTIKKLLDNKLINDEIDSYFTKYKNNNQNNSIENITSPIETLPINPDLFEENHNDNKSNDQKSKSHMIVIVLVIIIIILVIALTIIVYFFYKKYKNLAQSERNENKNGDFKSINELGNIEDVNNSTRINITD